VRLSAISERPPALPSHRYPCDSYDRRAGLAAGAGVEVDGSLSGAGGSILLRCGMERATLENDLIRAEAHVANGQARIARQREIIAELDREGQDTAPAKDMLASFERTQAMHIANRDRIAGKLAVLD
jgi:hypothetical protein